jgi:beta-glucosidase
MPSALIFPQGFLWGISTSGYQFEGQNSHSQWTDWEEMGRIKTGERSGLACNWWEHAEKDFDLARQLGVNALRLSVEWSRVEPEPGKWNEEAIHRYRSMLMALRQRGILPMVCLHHFTHPRWFEEQGAFLAPNADALFERFSRYVVSSLGDLCDHWVTFNEPNVYCALAYVFGEHPPGKRGEIRSVVQALTRIAHAHQRAYEVIHSLQPTAQVGWTTNYLVFQPADENSRLDRMIAALHHNCFNMSFARLLSHGSLPFPLNLWRSRNGKVQSCCDFVGVNVYSRVHVKFHLGLASQLFGHLYIPDHVVQGDPGVQTPFGEIHPQAITAAVESLHQPGKPIYILENGVPDRDDRIRPWLIKNAVREVHQLIQRGFDVRGYFHWSLLDNFEWSEGWNLRFGLVSLDPETQERQLRPSAQLYSAIARANGLVEEEEESTLSSIHAES